ncbi:hydrogenase nickel incorporation protein HypB [Sporomusaceae bacterium BoRhaA]|uniref:hydrogenase nickel incorporation protein HypB n=1 Tax=Pelorhabdus rhamnosifermentans TaxID=2772457 RepID=UPI001C0637CC|nr:hydrogenase nickel incorporation protein HypB [Pelorhabdus rhamnosifermentans]MBU2702371.1 hydrogenase nickel incorporation protein HypB [Pelorhabdus rhamnosifermentans]
MEIQVMENILSKNDKIAAEINAIFSSHGIFVLNLLGSPGSGKTSLLEQTIMTLKGDIRMAVIEGDLFTSKDADRIARYGVPVVQINTSGGCHLDATMVKGVLDKLALATLDLIIIENVGNLICPAEFNIGEDVKAMVLSITEGEDKPLKYPLMFKQASIAVLNKIDLLPYTSFDMAAATEDILSINPKIGLVVASCRSGEGLNGWYEWIKQQVINKKAGRIGCK